MNSSFVFSSRHIDGGEQCGKYYVKGSSICVYKNVLCIKLGYLYPSDLSPESIIDRYLEKGSEGLYNYYKGEYTFFLYDIEKDKVVITNDYNGRFLIYYYITEDSFHFSNNFWDIINCIAPKEEDIDINNVITACIYYKPLFENTIIKNLYIVKAASVLILNCSSHSFTNHAYWTYNDVTNINVDLDEAVDQFIKYLKDGADFIKNYAHGRRVGITVSGGLDSRLTPAFFQDYENVLYYVLVGPSRTNPLNLTPVNFKYIDKIGKCHGIHINKIDASLCSASDRIKTELKYFPIGPCDFGKTIVKPNEVDVEINVNTGGPEQLSTLFTILENSDKDLCGVIDETLSNRYIFTRRISKNEIAKRLFNRSNARRPKVDITRVGEFFPVKGIKSTEFYTRVHKDIIDRTRPVLNSRAAMKTYLYHSVAIGNINGAYENLTGQIDKSFSILYPFCFDLLAGVPSEYINNREILKKTIEKVDPRLAAIASEHSFYGIREEKSISVLKHFVGVINERFRGISFPFINAVDMEEMRRLFLVPNDFYDKIFDKELIISVSSSRPDIFLSYLKVKLVLDIILKRGWQEYVD